MGSSISISALHTQITDVTVNNSSVFQPEYITVSAEAPLEIFFQFSDESSLFAKGFSDTKNLLLQFGIQPTNSQKEALRAIEPRIERLFLSKIHDPRVGLVLSSISFDIPEANSDQPLSEEVVPKATPITPAPVPQKEPDYPALLANPKTRRTLLINTARVLAEEEVSISSEPVRIRALEGSDIVKLCWEDGTVVVLELQSESLYEYWIFPVKGEPLHGEEDFRGINSLESQKHSMLQEAALAA